VFDLQDRFVTKATMNTMDTTFVVLRQGHVLARGV